MGMRERFPTLVSGSFQTSFKVKPSKDMKGQISPSPEKDEALVLFLYYSSF